MITHSLLYNLSYPVDPKNHPAPLRVVVDHSKLGVAEKRLGPHSKTRVGQRDRCREEDPVEKGEHLDRGQMEPVGY